MSPTETTAQPGLLEHPAEAFSYFRREGVPRVVCEEKHMGSRAVVIVCRNGDAARRRFGVVGEGIGICYTRTGRRFFDDARIEKEFLDKVREALDVAGTWEQFQTDWICLDAELMPWSAKAQELLRQQYAAVGPQRGGPYRKCRFAGTICVDKWRWSGSCRALRATTQIRELVCGFLSSLLLAGTIRQRFEACAVPPTGDRRSSSHAARSRLAYGETRGGLQSQ